MECRPLNLVIISAKGLKKPRFTRKMHVYAVASISDTFGGKTQKQKTVTDKHGDADPAWNFPMKFTINEAVGLQNRLTLVVKIEAFWFFGKKNIGEVHVPVKELMEGVKAEGKTMQFVSYEVRSRSGKPKGVLSFKYEFGEKFVKPEEPVTAYPASYAVTGGRYYQQQNGYGGYQQQQQGYGYYPQQPGYGAYPPPQPVVQPQRSRMGGSGMGFGTGLLGGALGGMLLGEMMSGGHHGGGCGGGCGGGGCGGGGCGGGCGGGGCGGF